MTATIVRARTEAECAPLRPLVEAHARYERSDATLPADWPRLVADLIAGGKLDLFVALQDQQAVGYASLTHDVSTWAAEPYGHLDCLYLALDRRGNGVGRQLLDAVAARAQDLGYSQLQWQTPVWNLAAARFYYRAGARSTQKERFTLTVSDHVGS